MDPLVLQRREERLGHRIIVQIPVRPADWRNRSSVTVRANSKQV